MDPFRANKESQHADTLRRMQVLANWMDTAFQIPGTRIRIGWDGILGFLFPGIGDGVTALAAFYLITQAAQAGAPKVVLARMVLNLAIELLVGIIPVLGDLFDVYWKANIRNLRLFEGYLKAPRPVKRRSMAWLLALFFLLFVMFAAFLLAVLGGLYFLIGLIRGEWS